MVMAMLCGASATPAEGSSPWIAHMTRPVPVAHVGHVLTVLSDVVVVFGQARAAIGRSASRVGAAPDPGHACDDVEHEMEAVDVVHHHHVERRRRRAALLV